MSDDREKNAALIRNVAAQADTDGLERFMAQYSRAAVAEWLIAGEVRWWFPRTLTWRD